jgi:hypothetical protein
MLSDVHLSSLLERRYETCAELFLFLVTLPGKEAWPVENT